MNTITTDSLKKAIADIQALRLKEQFNGHYHNGADILRTDALIILRNLLPENDQESVTPTVGTSLPPFLKVTDMLFKKKKPKRTLHTFLKKKMVLHSGIFQLLSTGK